MKDRKNLLFFLALPLIGLASLIAGALSPSTPLTNAQGFVDRILRPCSAGATQRASVIVNPNSTGNITMVTCTGGSVTINGSAIVPGGATVNPTNTFLPYRLNATTFSDSPLARTSATVITSTAGLRFSPDNTIDIGATGALRPANGFFGATLTSPVYISGAANPADAGAVRLGNTELIEWEKAVPGTDWTLGVTAADVLASSAPFSAPSLILNGSTSGTLTLLPAAIAGSNTLRFPAGTTDFTATGGASQVVKQVGVGVAFTVARLACADLSDSGAGCTAGASAPTTATYITQTPDAGLSAEQALSALSTGILGVTTATGVVNSITTSAGIRANLSDENGTGAALFDGATSPTFSTSILFGAGATFPMLKRSSTGIISRLADDSADTSFQASIFIVGAGTAVTPSLTTAVASGAGFYFNGGNPAISKANTLITQWSSTVAQFTVPIEFSLGSGPTLSTPSAGIVQVGTTASNSNGALMANAIIGGGSIPAASSGTIGTGSKNTAGFITSTTTGVFTTTLTFNGFTATTGWSCGVSNQTTGNLIRQTGGSTTTAVFSGTTVNGDIISYVCAAY